MSEKHKQVAAQCRVVAHLATVIAQVHSDKAELMAANAMPTIVDLVGQDTAGIMETLGDILNGMDAVTEDDEWTDQVFKEAHRLFLQPEDVTIPRAQFEAMEAAARALTHVYRDDGCEQESWRECREALAALRAAGIETEGEGK